MRWPCHQKRGAMTQEDTATSGLGYHALVVLVALAMSAVNAIQAQQQVVLFSDGFDHGAANWQLDPGWQIIADGPNHVLASRTSANAVLLGTSTLGTIEALECKMRIDAGGVQVSYRLDTQGLRYFFNIDRQNLELIKTVFKNPRPSSGDPFDYLHLAQAPIPFEFGAWFALTVSGLGNTFLVSFNGTELLSFTDTDNPYLSGAIGFQSIYDPVGILVDDVVLRGPAPTGPVWVSTGGPRGGIGYDIRMDPRDPNVLWATDAYAGVHQSTDGGVTWQPRNNGITARAGVSGDAIPIFSLTIDPRSPDTMWAGTLGMRGVFKTTNAGAQWIEMDNGIASQPSMEIRSFTVDPRNSNVVYCGGNYMADPTTQKQRGFIYRTTDGGKSWSLLAEPGALVRWIIVDPRDSNVIYASTGIFDRWAVKPEGVLKSLDRGRTWMSVNTGLTNLVAAALTMSPADPLTLIAGTGKSGAFADEPSEIYGGVFKTTDGGQHWRQVDPIHASGGNEIRFSAVAFAPSDPRVVYADSDQVLLRSADSGEHWEVIRPNAQGESRGQPIALVVHPSDRDTVFMNAYGGGVFVTHDGGATWLDASSGYTGATVWDLAIDPSSADHLLAGNLLSETRNGGHSWRGRQTTSQLNGATAVAIDPTDGETWLAGGQLTGWIQRTADGGDTWTYVLPSLGVNTTTGRRSVYRLVYSPTSRNVVYAATGVETRSFNPDPLASQGPGVYKSTDSGRSWRPVNGGLESTSQTVLSLAVHPTNADIVYIGLLDKGVYKSTDGGTAWRPSSQGLRPTEIRSLAIDSTTPNTIYAGAGQGGVWKSVDAGASWKQISAGMPPEANVRALVVDPVHSATVYAADLQSGVYRSTDGGATWTAINNGLRNRAVNALSLTPDGLHLYAATEGSGAFRLDLPDQSRPRRHLGQQ
jgi:photosystem II stability/assembly factor-like uncharacterized protein